MAAAAGVPRDVIREARAVRGELDAHSEATASSAREASSARHAARRHAALAARLLALRHSSLPLGAARHYLRALAAQFGDVLSAQ